MQWRLPIPWRQLRLLSLFCLAAPLIKAQTCNVCGSLGPDSVRLPDKKLGIQGVPTDTCGDVEAFAVAMTADSQLCRAVQAFGPFCGCNIAPTACSLCWDGSTVPNKQQTVPSLNMSLYLPLGLSVPNTFNCEQLESFLHFGEMQDSNQCVAAQQDLGETCGCPPLLTNSTNFFFNRTVEPEIDRPAINRTEPAEETQRCSICPNGVTMENPDRVLSINDASQNLRCRDWDRIANVADASSDDCSLFGIFASYCGCQDEHVECSLCPNGEPVPKPNQIIDWFPEVQNIGSAFQSADVGALTCDLMASIVASEEGIQDTSALLGFDSDKLCTIVQMKSSICGCSPDWRQFLMTWSYRTSGMLSILGSSFIVYDVLRKPKKHRFTTYHQLVLGISVYDIIGSIAYTLVAVMAPRGAGFHQSQGNDTTCTLQGFMVQLGQSSMFYNIFLALYFLMVIVFNWKERNLRRLCPVAHILVLSLGVGLAFSVIPFVGPQFGMCGVLPPLRHSEWLVKLFYTGPVCATLSVLTIVTAVICCKVYHQQKQVQRWMYNRSLKLARVVFWQSFWYVMAFYLTLPPVLFTFYIEFTRRDHIWLMVMAAALAPLQGFINFLVYFQRSRRKIVLSMCRCVRGGTPSKSLISAMFTSFRNPFVVSKRFWGRDHEEEQQFDQVGNAASSATSTPDTLVPVNKNDIFEQEDRREEDVNESELGSVSTGFVSSRRRFSGVAQHWMLNEDWDTGLGNSHSHNVGGANEVKSLSRHSDGIVG